MMSLRTLFSKLMSFMEPFEFMLTVPLPLNVYVSSLRGYYFFGPQQVPCHSSPLGCQPRSPPPGLPPPRSWRLTWFRMWSFKDNSLKLDQITLYHFIANTFWRRCLYILDIFFFIHRPKNTGAWKGRLKRFFVDPKAVELAKNITNIIWRYSKN